VLLVKVFGVRKFTLLVLGIIAAFIISSMFTSIMVGYVTTLFEFIEGPIGGLRISDPNSLSIYTGYVPLHIALSLRCVDPYSYSVEYVLAVCNGIPVIVVGLDGNGYKMLVGSEYGGVIVGSSLAHRLGLKAGDVVLLSCASSRRVLIVRIDKVCELNGRLNEVIILPIDLAHKLHGRPHNVVSAVHVSNSSILEYVGKVFDVNVYVPVNGVLNVICSDGRLFKSIKVTEGFNELKLPFGYYNLVFTSGKSRVSASVMIYRDNITVFLNVSKVKDYYIVTVYDFNSRAFIDGKVVEGNVTSFGRKFVLPRGLVTVYAYGRNYTLYLDSDIVLHPLLEAVKGLETHIKALWFNGSLFHGIIQVESRGIVIYVGRINGTFNITLPPGNYVFKLIGGGVTLSFECTAGRSRTVIVPPSKPMGRVNPLLLTRAGVGVKYVDRLLTSIIGLNVTVFVSLVLALSLIVLIIPWFIGMGYIVNIRREVKNLNLLMIPSSFIRRLVIFNYLLALTIGTPIACAILYLVSHVDLGLTLIAFSVRPCIQVGLVYGFTSLIVLGISIIVYLRRKYFEH